MIATPPRAIASDVEDKGGTAESICLPGQGLTTAAVLRFPIAVPTR